MVNKNNRLISYCLTFDMVSFGLTTISFFVSLRNLIIILNDELSFSLVVVCSQLFVLVESVRIC